MIKVLSVRIQQVCERWKSFTFSLILSLTGFTASAIELSQESVGTLAITDVLLRPAFVLREPKRGEFTLGESSFEVTWSLEDRFSGHLRLGSEELVSPMARFSKTVSDDIVFVEAYAQFESEFGRFRLGKIPIEFGAEGSWQERDLVFPRSQIFRERVVGLRDLGGSYEIEHNGFFTTVVVHNGESDKENDGRIWYTARWGWRDRDRFELGAAGQTGSTRPVATSASQDTLAGVDVTKDAHWRTGGLFVQWLPRYWRIVAEAYLGEVEQETNATKYSVGHLDVGYQIAAPLSVSLRYDQFDPNHDQSDDIVREASIVFGLQNKTGTSSVYLIGKKAYEEGPNVANDELRLVWRLTPAFRR